MAAQVKITFSELEATAAYAPQVKITFSELEASQGAISGMGISRLVAGTPPVWVAQTRQRQVGGAWT